MAADKQRILIISNMYPSADSGYFGVFVRNINENLKLTFEVDEVLIRGRGNNFLSKLGKYVVFYTKIGFNLFFKKHKLIYVHFPPYSFPPILFSLFIRKQKLILNFHGSDIMLDTKLNLLFIKYFKLVKSNVKLIIAPSEHLKNEIVKKLNFQGVEASPSGGVEDFFYRTIANENKHKSENLRLVFISSLNESKGIFDLLVAVKQINIEGLIKVDLTIYGAGVTDRLLDEIKQDENIKFRGIAIHNLLPSVFNDFDVFVFPSRRESLGLIGIEALACGIPVLASNIPGINSYVKHGYNGLLFELNNMSDLISNIEFLSKNPNELNRLQLNASSSVVNFKRSIVADNLNKRISEII